MHLFWILFVIYIKCGKWSSLLSWNNIVIILWNIENMLFFIYLWIYLCLRMQIFIYNIKNKNHSIIGIYNNELVIFCNNYAFDFISTIINMLFLSILSVPLKHFFFFTIHKKIPAIWCALKTVSSALEIECFYFNVAYNIPNFYSVTFELFYA